MNVYKTSGNQLDQNKLLKAHRVYVDYTVMLKHMSKDRPLITWNVSCIGKILFQIRWCMMRITKWLKNNKDKTADTGIDF